MANTYYDSELTAEEIENALEAIDGVIVPANNGKVLAVENGKIIAKSVVWPGANMQSKTVTPDAAGQTVEPDSGYDGLSAVTINGDADLVAGNIKKDVNIFGVTGSYEGGSPALQSKTVTPGASQQTVQPDSGYDGLSSVVVNGDADLVAGNIKKDVEIFGVTGSYEGGGGSTLITKSITQNGIYNASSDNADGYSQVTVNVSGGGSPNDLLFHFDNNIKNSGNLPCVIMDNTGLEISNEQSKFGTNSLKCGSTQTRYNYALGLDFDFGANDFTLDFWCYPTSLGTSASQVPISFDYRSLAIYLKLDSINIAVAKTSGSWVIDTTVSVSISLNQWHHIAVVRDGLKIYVFLDGTKTIDATFGADAIASTSYMTIGSNSYQAGNRRFNGYIDELRMLLGQAVWTDDFTPPTQPYT